MAGILTPAASSISSFKWVLSAPTAFVLAVALQLLVRNTGRIFCGPKDAFAPLFYKIWGAVPLALQGHHIF